MTNEWQHFDTPFDFGAAQENPDFAKRWLRWIVEKMEQGEKLSPNSEHYLLHCLREIGDGKDPNHAFNLVASNSRPSTRDRDMNLLTEYYLRRLYGEKGAAIQTDFENDFGIKSSTFSRIRANYKEICKMSAQTMFNIGKKSNRDFYEEDFYSQCFRMIERCKKKTIEK